MGGPLGSPPRFPPGRPDYEQPAAHMVSGGARRRGRLAALATLHRRLPRWTQLPQRVTLGITVVAVAALAAFLSDAAPTGQRALDEAYVGALVAAVAFFAASARRWTWFVPAGVGSVVALDWWAVAVAAVAVALGLWSVVTDSRTPARAALVAGLGMAALLRAEPVAFHGSTALLTAAAVVPVLLSGYRLAGRRTRRRTRQVALILSGVGFLMLVGAAIGVGSVANDLVDGTRLLDEGVVAARDADDQAAAQRLGQAARHLQSASGTLESWFVSPARGLPFVGPNLEAVSRLADDTSEVARLSSHAASSVDVDALQFADGRLDPELVERVADSLEPVALALDRAESSLDDVRSPWLVEPVRERMDRLEREVGHNGPDLDQAAEGARMAHALLGGDGLPRRYLVLFTTPVEARGRTGFPGNYAELEVVDGQISMPRFGRISELEQGGTPARQRTVAGPIDYLARYERFDPLGTWRNLTMSPDFPSIAQVAMELYPQSGGTEVSGVMSIDPTGLASLMRFTGPIEPAEVEGLTQPLTADNVAQYLHLDQYRQFAGANTDRVDVLEDVARITFERLTTNVDLPGPEEVVDVLSPVVEGGHIQFSTPLSVDYLDSIGLAGQFDPLACDFLSVTNNNAGGNKLDQFLERSLRYDVSWDPTTGDFASRVTATLRNAVTEADMAALPDYVVGNVVGLPRGVNRTYLSMYTCGTLTLDEARIDGQPAGLQAETELGRDVYSTFVDIPPGATVTVELDLRGNTGDTTQYPLTLAQQPLVRAEQAEVTVNVGGDQPLDASGDGVTVDGRTVHWAGPLDHEQEIRVTYDD